MEVKIFAFLLLLTIFEDSVHAGLKELDFTSDSSESPVESSTVSSSDLVIKSDGDTRVECVLIRGKESDDYTKKTYKIEVRGSTIRFSDVPRNWFEHCPTKTRYFEFFARDTIIIDKDILYGSSVQFVAIAPKLVVKGKRTINLNGREGEKHEKSVADSGKAGEAGDDGLPGLPGSAGGIFTAISDEIINKDQLLIFADGGTGGPGQDGGVGGKAEVPKIPDLSAVNNKEMVLYTTSSHAKNYNAMILVAGGNGGNGGQGGYGGEPGQIFVYQLGTNLSNYQPIPVQGRPGNPGAGGAGGLGTMYNSGLSFKAPNSEIERKYTVLRFDGINKKDAIEFMKHGVSGKAGGNTYDIKPPMEFDGYQEFTSILNSYKNFIRPYLKKSNETEKLNNFYEKLLNDKAINRIYGTFGLLDELKGLEKQYLNLARKVDLSSAYDNLRKRIEKYAKHPKNRESSKDYRVALAYAHMATLTRSSRLNEMDIFIVNLKDYLDIVFKSLEKLKENTVQYEANNQNQDYENAVEKNIEEVQVIIESQVKPEFTKLNKLMKNKLQDLIKETLKLQNQNIEKKAALEKLVDQQGFYTIMKTISVAASALVPGAQVAAAVAFTGIQVGETFAPEYEKGETEIKLPEAVTNHFKGGYEFIQNAQKNILKSLQEQISFLNQKQREIQDMSSGGRKTIGDQKKATQSARNALTMDLKKLQDEIKNFNPEEKSDDESDSSKLLEIVSKLSVLFVQNGWNYAMIDVIKADVEKLTKYKKDLQSVGENIKNVRNYQERINKEFMPVFEVMYRDLPSDRVLSVKSMAALDISKWKVHTALNNVKLIVRKFTNGFEVSDEMILLVESLERTMNILISMYDRIQSYQREKTLATYIKNMATLDYWDFHSSNKALENSMLEIRTIICINLALIEYKRIFTTFKQNVFPFAKDYLTDIMEPDVLESRTANYENPSVFFREISSNLNKIQGKHGILRVSPVRLYESQMNLVHTKETHDEIYEWKNETDNEMISNLLAGHEVILNPDARTMSYYAVKFKQIRIRLIAKDQRNQKALNMKLNSLRMMMVHEGNSYYTCGNRMYLISHPTTTFEESFNGKNPSKSYPSKTIEDGDAVASPFATWRVRLVHPKEDYIKENYLSEFKNKVDLLLEAPDASVVLRKNVGFCDQNPDLSKYYDEYVPLLDIHKPMMNVSN